LETAVLGIKTHYIQEGEGGDVLLLHGWGCSAETLAPLVTLLKTRYRVTAVDLPGFGKTDEPGEPIGVAGFADFVFGFIGEMGIKDVILIGHSLGGQIITKMMADINRNKTDVNVVKVVLIGSAGARPKKGIKTRVKVRLFKMWRFVLGMPPVNVLFPGALERLKAKSGSADYRNASEMMRKCLVRVVNEDLTPLFGLNNADTLLVWGENDTATPLEHGRLMERLMPNAGLAVVANAGHYPFLESPAVFNSILGSYLL
jgi:pimeloyl-ACP methyl ester carboxylesterase